MGIKGAWGEGGGEGEGGGGRGGGIKRVLYLPGNFDPFAFVTPETAQFKLCP